MMKNKKWLSCFLVSFAVLLLAAGCGMERPGLNWYDFGAEYQKVAGGVVAENQNYSLAWNQETGCVTLEDKVHQMSWSNIPTDAEGTTTHPQVYSPLLVEYVESGTLLSNTVDGYTGSIKKGNFSAEKIENGIQVTYYFTDVAISIPVKYVLRDDSLAVSVDPSAIGEDEQLCTGISLMPFTCSVQNAQDTKDSYLFVPSGSGALVYPKIIGEGITSMISEEVYGSDAQINSSSVTQKETVHLPVYGAKNGEQGVCAIIESAAETAKIQTNVGSSSFGYSAVYTSFNIRGSQVSSATYMKNLGSNKTLFEQSKVDTEIVVGFYPLTGSDADYSGMAKRYQNYLAEQGELTEKEEDTLLNLRFIGGVMSKEYLLGVPYETLMPVTTFADVNDIVKEIQNFYQSEMNVSLVGFGKSGLTVEKAAGAAGYNGKFGSMKELKLLKDDELVSLYFDFDLLHFAKSGVGVNTFNGMAKSAIGGKTQIREQSIQFSSTDWTSSISYMVRRDALEKISEKVLNNVKKWNIDGVSYGTLGHTTYSDYNNLKYGAKSGFASQAGSLMEGVKEAGYKMATNGANAYAAVRADQVYDAPTESSGYQVYDCDVPFYQMVFKGYVPMSSKAVNFSADEKEAVLKAVESGLGLTYTLIEEYTTDILATKENAFYGAVYKDNEASMKATLEAYTALFEQTKNTKIERHELLSDAVRKTVYENGTEVYVNYGSEEAVLDDGSQIAAKSFVVKGGNAQ